MVSNLLYQPEHADWEPLRAVLTDDALGDWMWMHAQPAEDGTLVHYYKHVWSRRYVRLDADSRVYAERAGGGPERIPACSGAMLLLALTIATAICEGDVGEVVRVPALARAEPTLVEDLPVLLEMAERFIDDILHSMAALPAENGVG